MDSRSLPAMISVPNPPITSIPTDFRQYKLSSPEESKSPLRPESISPVTSPPTLPPTSMTMVSMASMFSRPPSFGFPGAPFPSGFPPKEYPRLPEEYANMHRLMQERPFSRSPTPIISPNDPMANDCKIVDFRGEKIAAFVINGKTMLCLPQAFELFLKNLVGGLHTVYTKLKRLEITPIVCNVEQVRILRGLGAIQPGVNRCKLLSDKEFDELYKDCTTSRPGRPPKRVMPFQMSPQDVLLQQMRPSSDPFGRDVPFHPRHPSLPMDAHSPPRPPFPASLPPHLNPLMALGNPAAAQVAQAALLSRNGVLPGQQLPSPTPENLLETYKQSYGDMLKHLQGIQRDQAERNSLSSQDNESPVLNLSQSHSSDGEKLDNGSIKSDSDIIENDDINSNSDNMEYEDDVKEHAMDTNRNISEGGKITSMFGMMNHIQTLINTAVENAKHEEKQLLSEKSGLREELLKEKDSLKNLRKQVEDEQKNSEIYLRRFRKEKKLRRKLQEQLDQETKKIEKLEAALKAVSYETLVQIKDSIAKEGELNGQHHQEKDTTSCSLPSLPLVTSLPLTSLPMVTSLPLVTSLPFLPVSSVCQRFNQHSNISSPAVTSAMVPPLLATNVR